MHKVWTDSEASYHEINIGAEYLSRPIENVLATLLHEMVHLYCMVMGIQDTSNGGRYQATFMKERGTNGITPENKITLLRYYVEKRFTIPK